MPTQPLLKPLDNPPMSRAREARRELLERISDFIMRHDLNVTGANLAAIGTALSGTNVALAEAVAQREIAREPIDQRWLDTVMRLDPETGKRMNELEKLMDRMEYALMRFAQTAKSAQDETCEHRGALGAEIERLSINDDAQPIAPDVTRVIDLSRAMLDRLSEAEAAMERSQAETDKLRSSLAEARIEADVDHLTRLPNRRSFERQLIAAAQKVEQEGAKLCVAFCDVDNFKQVNDKHGHDAGDRVLVAIAGTLNDHASNDCFVARHGGEEFVLLLHDVDLEEAWRKLDAVRRAQALKRMVNRETGKSFGKITFSGGIAQVHGAGDARDALARADAALYEAKREGRDRIVTG
ncbi:putative diguanylate cyclase (GGDEF) [Erythrobacter sp. NAP1]|uniref:GGDEF domain-containing protein n=1 Tax=Erythrobacter sp. NAP1 TaxID=237727 RepID=UPI0000687850|nr:GGDEF domain-containing protein [Erythrobacter sp. NAP1]EAQ28872.1 putative diguanylate cyclase (GGDEF) [Erythrobacter sp. NAP1]